MIPPVEFSTELMEIPDFEGPEQSELYYDVPIRYGGTLSDNLPQSSGAEETTFNINTSAREAQAIVDQKPQEEVGTPI